MSALELLDPACFETIAVFWIEGSGGERDGGFVFVFRCVIRERGMPSSLVCTGLIPSTSCIHDYMYLFNGQGTRDLSPPLSSPS